MSEKKQPAAWQWTPEQEQTLTRMWDEGCPIPEIATEIGCSWSQASRCRERLGIPQRPKGWQPNRPMAERVHIVTPPKPNCTNPDAAFARAMAGRSFGSLSMKANPTPPVQTSARPSGAGMWASSITLNA